MMNTYGKRLLNFTISIFTLLLVGIITVNLHGAVIPLTLLCITAIWVAWSFSWVAFYRCVNCGEIAQNPFFFFGLFFSRKCMNCGHEK